MCVSQETIAENNSEREKLKRTLPQAKTAIIIFEQRVTGRKFLVINDLFVQKRRKHKNWLGVNHPRQKFLGTKNSERNLGLRTYYIASAFSCLQIFNMCTTKKRKVFIYFHVQWDLVLLLILYSRDRSCFTVIIKYENFSMLGKFEQHEWI